MNYTFAYYHFPPIPISILNSNHLHILRMMLPVYMKEYLLFDLTILADNSNSFYRLMQENRN